MCHKTFPLDFPSFFSRIFLFLSSLSVSLNRQVGRADFILNPVKLRARFKKNVFDFRLLLQVRSFIHGNSLWCKRQPMCFQSLPLWRYLHPSQRWFHLPVPGTVHRPKVCLYGILCKWTSYSTEYKYNTFSVFLNLFSTSSSHFETHWSWLMPAPMLQPWISLYLILFTQLTVRQWLFCCYCFFSSFEGANWVHIAKTILVKTVASALTVWMDLFVSVKQAFGEKGE